MHGIVASQLAGHWITDSGNPRNVDVGEALEFRSAKREDVSYIWGGALVGVQFDTNHHVEEFSNVGCSDESDPVDDHSESWLFVVPNTLVIDGNSEMRRFTVLALDGDRLRIRLDERYVKEL